MGYIAQDLIPIASYGPTAQTPPGKADLNKVFQVARTDTAAVVKAVLPASASILGVYMYGSVASDAATSASVTITVSDASGTISTGSVDVKANGAVSALVQMSNLPNLQKIPANGDLKITAQYAEGGTASTTGGPWNFRVAYAA